MDLFDAYHEASSQGPRFIVSSSSVNSAYSRYESFRLQHVKSIYPPRRLTFQTEGN
jgi:hypothetical protein